MSANEEPRGRTAEERDYYSHSRSLYAVLAHVYDAVVSPFRALRREVASAIEIRPGSRLLDVATGTGQQAFAFAEKAREVVGIDLSEAMLRVARRKNRFSNVSFQQADAAELPFENDSFDATCVSFALHEMPGSVRQRVVREMARVTKPAGSITIVDYGMPHGRVMSAVVYHVVKLYEHAPYAAFVKSDWRVLLQSAGVEPADQRPALHGLATILTGRKPASIDRSRSEVEDPMVDGILVEDAADRAAISRLEGEGGPCPAAATVSAPSEVKPPLGRSEPRPVEGGRPRTRDMEKG